MRLINDGFRPVCLGRPVLAARTFLLKLSAVGKLPGSQVPGPLLSLSPSKPACKQQLLMPAKIAPGHHLLHQHPNPPFLFNAWTAKFDLDQVQPTFTPFCLRKI